MKTEKCVRYTLFHHILTLRFINTHFFNVVAFLQSRPALYVKWHYTNKTELNWIELFQVIFQSEDLFHSQSHENKPTQISLIKLISDNEILGETT